MIDINQNNLRILPAEHIILKHIGNVERVQRDNKILKSAFIISVLLIAFLLVYTKPKDNERK
jgi:hypothetical protein